MAIIRLDTKSEEKLHNITWYSTNISVVSVGAEISFTKIWRACVLKALYLVDLYDVIFHL